jgi:hypothetical protein
MALEAFAAQWNTVLAHPFQWSYDGSGLHQKVVQRFTKMLRCSAQQLDVRILTKQMKLMTNLLSDYLSEVSEESWGQLCAVLGSQSDAITALIEDERGPQRKRNAAQALANLTAAIQDNLATARQLAAPET